MCSLASQGRGQSGRNFRTTKSSQLSKCPMANSSVAQILASASYDDTIKLYIDDPSDDWFCAATIPGHESTVWSLAWEPENGRYLASGSDDKTIRIWRRLPSQGELKFQCVAVLEGHERSVYSISWSRAPAGLQDQNEGRVNLGWLASTGGDGTIRVWQITVRLWDCCIGSVSNTLRRRRLLMNLKGHLVSSTTMWRGWMLHMAFMM